MNNEKTKQAQESIVALEDFIITFNNLLANIDKTIENKVQKALEGKSIPQTNINDIIDERVKLGLTNFFKQSISQLETTSEQITEQSIEKTMEETQKNLNPSHYTGSPKRKQQQVIVVDVLKKYKKPIAIKDLVRILKEEHNITWSNPTNELTSIMKRYPVEKASFGKYQYIGK